jgi:hypothetical protein
MSPKRESAGDGLKGGNGTKSVPTANQSRSQQRGKTPFEKWFLGLQGKRLPTD